MMVAWDMVRQLSTENLNQIYIDCIEIHDSFTFNLYIYVYGTRLNNNDFSQDMTLC